MFQNVIFKILWWAQSWAADSDGQDSSPCLIWDLSALSPLCPPSLTAAATNYGQASIFLVTVFTDRAIGNISLDQFIQFCFEDGIKQRTSDGDCLFGLLGELSVKRLLTGGPSAQCILCLQVALLCTSVVHSSFVFGLSGIFDFILYLFLQFVAEIGHLLKLQ